MLRYVLILIFATFVLSCGEEKAIIDQDNYDYPDEALQLQLQDYPAGGKRIENLFVHCTASREGMDLSLQWFLDFFRYDRGWSRPGYHFLILLDGTVEVMWPNNLDPYLTQSEVTNGAYGYNDRSIHIAYVGGVDRNLRGKDTRTPEQIRAMDNLINQIVCKIPDIQVRPHNDVASKDCPSFDVHREYGYLNVGAVNTGELFDYFKQDSL